MSDTLESAKAIRAAADRSGRIFNVGFVLHFAPSFQFLKRRIAEGALGNLLHVHARLGTYITLVNSRSRYQATHPGSLFLDYSHQPDLFYWLTGKVPSSVHVTALQSGNLPLTSNPNVAAITYNYAGEMLATLHLNYVQMPECHDYEIVGDEGWAQLTFPAGRVTFGRRSDENLSVETLRHERDDLFRAQQQAFFDAIDGLCPPATSAADGLVSNAVCQASIQSWQSDECVTVSQFSNRNE